MRALSVLALDALYWGVAGLYFLLVKDLLPRAAVRRSYYSATLAEFCATDRVEILGQMARQNRFDLTLAQRDAWLEQAEIDRLVVLLGEVIEARR